MTEAFQRNSCVTYITGCICYHGDEITVIRSGEDQFENLTVNSLAGVFNFSWHLTDLSSQFLQFIIFFCCPHLMLGLFVLFGSVMHRCYINLIPVCMSTCLGEFQTKALFRWFPRKVPRLYHQETSSWGSAAWSARLNWPRMVCLNVIQRFILPSLLLFLPTCHLLTLI